MRPVLILGSEARIAVPVARCLHKHGIPVIVAGSGPGQTNLRSRAVRRWMHVEEFDTESEAALFAVLELAREEGADMLIPTSDSALLFVARHYRALAERVQPSCPEPRTLQSVLNKAETLRVARSIGIPVPVTYPIASIADLNTSGQELQFPVVAKARDKNHMGPFKVKHLLSLREVEKTLGEDPQFGEHLLLQEYCPGEGVGVEILMHQSRPVAVFQHRRNKELPPTGGVGVLVTAESIDPNLERMAVELLRGLEWQGVAMVEFRKDTESGRISLMEVNGRYWGSVSLPIKAGIHFPFYEWQLAHRELPNPPVRYRAGMQVRWTVGELQRLQDVLAGSQAGPFIQASRTREVLGFLKDLRPSVGDMVWSWRDPLPGWIELSRTFSKSASTLLKNLATRVIPPPIVQHLRTCRALGGTAGLLYTRLRILRAAGIPVDRMRRLPRKARRILFVCHGNIIRSPMAEALFRRELVRQSICAVSVVSAGLFSKPGRNADERAISVAKEFGISLEQHEVRGVTGDLIGQADAILVMDCLNEVWLLTKYPSARGKVFLLGGVARDGNRKPIEIADPYEGDVSDVRRCYESLGRKIPDLVQALFPWPGSWGDENLENGPGKPC